MPMLPFAPVPRFPRPILGPAFVFGSALCLLACLLLAGCAAADDPDQTELKARGEAPPAQNLPEAWRELALRLEADKQYDAGLDAILRKLEPPSPDPMGRKIQELYRIKFPPPPPPGAAPTTKAPPLQVYPNVVTPENAAECRAFIAQHEGAFGRAEARYHVPRSIAAALLFVETRLGRSPGKQGVLHTLASMANSREPGRIGVWLEKLNPPPANLEWIGETMLKRSDWAYKELVAFLKYTRANNIDPLTVPGSIYGAMGICQFMPSNIPIFAADGNGDGVIDLFQIDDAVASLSNYLVQHGWKPGADRKTQFAALKRYNHQNIYANTILCLADLVRGEAVGQLVLPKGKKKADRQAAKSAPAKTAAKTGAAAKTAKTSEKSNAAAAKTSKPQASKTASPKK